MDHPPAPILNLNYCNTIGAEGVFIAEYGADLCL